MFGIINTIPIFVLSKYRNDMNTQNNNTAYFYEGSYQFKSVETPLNITADYVQMQLAKQYEYRPTTESLWAEILVGGVKSRFELNYDAKVLVKLF